jgi:hypothetical protein
MGSNSEWSMLAALAYNDVEAYKKMLIIHNWGYFKSKDREIFSIGANQRKQLLEYVGFTQPHREAYSTALNYNMEIIRSYEELGIIKDGKVI